MQYKKNKGEVIQISNRHLMIRDTKLTLTGFGEITYCKYQLHQFKHNIDFDQGYFDKEKVLKLAKKGIRI